MADFFSIFIKNLKSDRQLTLSSKNIKSFIPSKFPFHQKGV